MGSAIPRFGGSAFSALSHRPFRLFWIGSTAAQFGFWFSHVSFQALMAEQTDDELWLAALFIATFAPVAIVGPFGGVLVDRLDRKRVMIGTYVFIAVVALLQVILVASDVVSPVMLLLTGAGVGCGLAFLGPASGAVVANTVPPSELRSAISIGSMSSNLSRIAGPAIAAPLIAAQFYEVTWGLYAAVALIAGLIIRGVTLFPYESDSDDARVVERLLSGLRHARERQPAARALLLTATMSIFGVSHVVVLPNFTEQALSRPAADFVWLGVATGAGALFGAFSAGALTGRASLRRGALLMVPYSVVLLAFSFAENFWLAIVLQVILGFFYFAGMTTVQIVVQEVIGEEHRGRVMSLLQICWAGLVPVGSLLIGLLAGDAGLGLGSARAITAVAVVGGLGSGWILATANRFDRSSSTPNSHEEARSSGNDDSNRV